MYAVNFTRLEKHSWFSLRPAARATHDNLICFCKDWQCICPSPLQYTIYYEKSAVFSLCSYTSPSSISDWSCETQKKSNCIKPPALACVLFKKYGRALSSPVHMRCDSQANCGKPSLLQSLSNMWSKWWHLHRKESFDVTASGSGVLYPPVTGCKMAYRSSNTLPALWFRNWKFIT